MEKKEIGKAGEEKAAKYLKKKGYKIIKSNFSCKMGEVDIIAEKGGLIIFIEVKTRVGSTFGKGFESVGNSKRTKIIKTAEYFLMDEGREQLARFDVISIDDNEITHIENAFGL